MKNSTNITIRQKSLRIIISCIIVIGMLGLFSSCGSSSNTDNSANNTANAVTNSSNSTNSYTSNENSNNTSTNDSGQSTSTTTKDSSNNNQQSQPQVQSAPVQSKPETTPQPPTTPSVSSEDSTIVYYVPGSKVYHLSKSDGTLSRSKNIQSMTLKEALAQGMHQSQSKADQ
ncbi:hypothetical protein [Clostridium pasteurianum]|uniref:Uncharacterized protein n=1 Tax=Clostridium pasteurianum BC1 TaxID=86416 RepID=R4KB01_CLOPA|nr:hypothetical protein [Clostridium pasteurianum]AGK97699.1 hypothetical protein Clopa_2861 [Clostridium pasteurianum BC1]